MAPNKQCTVLSIFGTRPEAIKMAPVILALQSDPAFRHVLVVTAQHREMLDQVLQLFKLKSDYDLDIMRPRQSLAQITTRSLNGLDRLLAKENPDLVLVHGDTTTTLAGALAAYYRQICIGHVEAGLRSFDHYNPFPEEVNRLLTDQLAVLHFAPTQGARKNLIREGISAKSIRITGNTAVDALLALSAQLAVMPLPPPLSQERSFILVEAHRRENWGEPLCQVGLALADIARIHPQVDIAISLHRNPVVRESLLPVVSGIKNIYLFEPLSLLDFLSLMQKCHFLVTDSGGIQEEAPSFHKPVLVTRKVTERPEGVQAGVVKVVGTERAHVRRACRLLLENAETYRRMTLAPNPYGDGRAAWRIQGILRRYFGFSEEEPEEFHPLPVQ
jgi:UDP-N-acetylglucosamine 2-epimerase (non-hydrolysing)